MILDWHVFAGCVVPMRTSVVESSDFRRSFHPTTDDNEAAPETVTRESGAAGGG